MHVLAYMRMQCVNNPYIKGTYFNYGRFIFEVNREKKKSEKEEQQKAYR